MEKNNVSAISIVEEYGDVYTDQVSMNETNIDDDADMNTCTMRMDDDDDDYDWVGPKDRQSYKSGKSGKLSFLNRNEKVALVAGIMVLVIVSTVLITRSITAPPCEEGWMEIGNKTCFKFLPTSCAEGCSFEKAKEICVLKGGKLAEPRDGKTFREIMEVANDSKKLSSLNFWIGLEFNPKEKQFQWLSDRVEARGLDGLWHNGNPSYDGSHVHLMNGQMMLKDVDEGEVYKPVCQRKKEHGCGNEWKSFGSDSLFCYSFMDQECEDGCNIDDAAEVCEHNDAYLAEDDLNFLTKFAKQLKLDVNWRIGVRYNHSADIFVRDSDGFEVDLSDVYTKEISNPKGNSVSYEYDDDNDDSWRVPDIHELSEYDYPEDLYHLLEDKDINDEGTTSCMEINSANGWIIKEGKCQRKQSKDLNVQPLCQM